MLIANVMERADDAALEKAVIAFRKVRVKDHATHKRLAVVNRVVAVEVLF